MRARALSVALAALALGAGVAACGGEQVSDRAPATTPPITVSEDDLAGLSGGDDSTLEDRTTSTTDSTATTPDEEAAAPADTGAAAPDTGAATPPAETPAPAAETPAETPADDTGGATDDPAPAEEGDSGDTGGAGFQDFCQQNPGAC